MKVILTLILLTWRIW